jgi:hypothetical protein
MVMEYRKLKSHKMSEIELRQLWKEEYCDPEKPVITFDGIIVKFYPEMFDHAFFESDNRIAKDKSILSLNRCEKMLWIKVTLQDPTAALKQGWISKTKSYDNSRRVALVKDNYVVIITIYTKGKARFISAYQIDDEDNLKKLLNGPDWT